MIDGQTVVVTGPASEPVSVAEAKEHLKVDDTADDTLIAGLVAAAREACEMAARRAFVSRTLDLRLASWPSGRMIEFPEPPLVSVTSISYTDEDGNAGTVSAPDYVVYNQVEPGILVLKPSAEWPSVTLMPGPSLVVRYVAGFGAPAAVPRHYKQAILLTIGHWYANRESVVIGSAVQEVPDGAKDLLRANRVGWF